MDDSKVIVIDKEEDVDAMLAWATGLSPAGIRAVFMTSRSAEEAFERFAAIARARGCTMALVRPDGTN